MSGKFLVTFKLHHTNVILECADMVTWRASAVTAMMVAATARGAMVIEGQHKSFSSRAGDEVTCDKVHEELKTRSCRSAGWQSSEHL